MSALLTAVLVLGQVAAPDHAEAEFAKAQQKKWEAFYRTEAASYTISLSGDPTKALKLRPEPVLQWSNPVRGGETNGLVFVWTHQGRVEVVGTVFSHLATDDPQQRFIAHSFHSLSLQPLAAERRESKAWSIQVPGLKPEPIPGAPMPAKSAALRLAQMRDLAREFSAATTSLENVEQELRLLPQPLYRFESESAEAIDGALFTFVTGTDPELMLLLEARPTRDGPAWHFGAGRFTDLALKLRYKEDVLWTYERGLTDNSTTPYLSRRTELRPRVLP
ncbi:MAG: hypothetical protein SH850_12940 [Planctomycetaceae bacterium]|nr:hypothetical protein [Planctomycetaceae bacterium]